jgi:ABC-type sugar transport system ATPase subunit
MIELQGVSISTGSWQLQDVSFRVERGQYAVVMGKTGIGKTSILECICGLRSVAAGRILISGVDVTGWPPADRSIGYTPQDLALFPTLTVRQHLEFAMQIRRYPRKKIADRVTELADLLQISHLLSRGIRGLSGGESQRVALGRALSAEPALLLLDEPVSALDSKTRQATQKMLKTLNEVTGVTVLHITHNRDEAIALADICFEIGKDDDRGRVSIRTINLREGSRAESDHS